MGYGLSELGVGLKHLLAKSKARILVALYLGTGVMLKNHGIERGARARSLDTIFFGHFVDLLPPVSLHRNG